MAIKRLDFECDVKLSDGGTDGNVGSVEGYASVFGLLDRGGDIVMPGAFKASLADWRKRKAAPPMLWQHNPESPIGTWPDLVEDEKGLKVRGDLILDVPLAGTVRALVKGGAVKGLSIGYLTKDYEMDRQTGARRLKKVDLWEISLVTFPMQPEATASVKMDFDAPGWEQAFRDEGLSNREAKLATSVARKLASRDGMRTGPASRDGMADALMSMRMAAMAFRD